MKKSFAAAAGVLLVAPLLAQAATVNLSNWAFGDSWGNVVDVTGPNHVGAAGGFKGAVAFAPGGELGFSGILNNWVTYCVEIDEAFTLPSGNLGGYGVVAGSAYGKWVDRNGNGKTAAAVSNRLGQLLGYVASNPTLVDSRAESTALQLAIWNVIYDNDDSVGGGLFRERSGAAFNAPADTLLQASASWSGMLDVFVLSRAGSQDFLLTRNSGRSASFGTEGITAVAPSVVPEPASLALVLAALGAAGAASRRRRCTAA